MQIGSVTFGGLVSGLDTNQLVDAIIGAERAPIDRLLERKELFEAKNTAYEEIRSALRTFRFAVQDVTRLGDLGGRVASTPPDDKVFNASAGPDAPRGTFDVTVTALAQAGRVRADEVANRDQPLVSDGTITIQAGSNDLISIDVSGGSGTNTLSAIRDSINAADSGVTASIINNGTGDVLVVRGDDTGTDNALVITDSTNLNLDSAGNVLEAAADATLTVDGIAITSGSNTVAGALQGVTLELTGTGTSSVVVENDVEQVKTSLQTFVEEYNKVIDILAERTVNGVDDTGILAGDSTVRRIQQSLGSIVASGVDGLPDGVLSSLAAIGIDLDNEGRLSIDSFKLDDRLESSFDEVKNVFLSSSSATDQAIQVQSAAFDSNGPFAIQITQAGEQARVVGSTAISSLGADETLTITVDGNSVDVDLLKNDEIQDIIPKINTALAAAGIEALASDDGTGRLAIATIAYGSAANIDVVSSRNDNGNGKRTGFDNSPINDVGQDVAGTIDGIAATGSGQSLTAAVDTDAEGLVIRVLTDAAGIASRSGDFGTVQTTDGLKDTLLDRVKLFSDPFTGNLATVAAGLKTNIDSMDDEIASRELRLESRRAFLILRFTEAEQALSALQSSGLDSLL